MPLFFQSYMYMYVHKCVCNCIVIYIDFNTHLRKRMNDFHILELQLQFKNKKKYYNSYILFATPPETRPHFTFYSYCLSLLKFSYPFKVWLCYTMGTLATQLNCYNTTTAFILFTLR